MLLFEKLKVKCCEAYFKTSPRYQSLGKIDDRLYFIDCYRGRVYCIRYNGLSDETYVAVVLDVS